MTLSQKLALWADRLRDLSAFGLRYAENIYDRERYEAIQRISWEMLSLATDTPSDRLEKIWAPIFSRPTPLTVGDAAVIDDAGRILLIQRADNRKWAMPGGALEVDETPAEGVAREAYEETGVRCQPIALVGVFDSRLCGSIFPFHMYHFLFLCQPLNGAALETASHRHEALATGWFAQEELPLEISPGHDIRIRQAFRVWHGDRQPYFDS
jgi:ADP-ribose pyrophosphatase YjhB (NUDIX family)